MSTENKFLLMRLVGPLQSWGSSSDFDMRGTELMPTKSGIAGLCCAALGYERGSDLEKLFIEQFMSLEFTAVALQKNINGNTINMSRMIDFNTIRNTARAAGGTKDCHLSHKEFLQDSDFAVIIAGNILVLEKIGNALKNPIWGLWLGRKCCTPSEPIFRGIFDSIEEIFSKINIGDNNIIHQDAINFSETDLVLMDVPISFDCKNRSFGTRFVKFYQH